MDDEILKRFHDSIIAEIHELRQELLVKSRALLSIDETARLLGVSPKTIRNSLGAKARKQFPVPSHKVGGRRVFRRIDIENYINRLGSTS